MAPAKSPRLTIPERNRLLAEWVVCNKLLSNQTHFCPVCKRFPRTYRLLIEWIRVGTVHDRLQELPAHLQQFYQDAFPTPTSKMVYGPSRNTVLVRQSFSDKPINSPFSSSRLRKYIPSKETETTFLQWLILGWCIRQADHERAMQISKYQEELSKYAKDEKQMTALFNLTFVPVEILDMTNQVRAFLDHTRTQTQVTLQSFRQKGIRGRKAKLVGHDEEEYELPPSTDWESAFLGQFGLKKKVAHNSRQELWTMIFVPLAHAFLPHIKGRKKGRDTDQKQPILPDQIGKIISRLIHLRYPNYWEDRWQKVRDRVNPYLVLQSSSPPLTTSSPGISTYHS